VFREISRFRGRVTGFPHTHTHISFKMELVHIVFFLFQLYLFIFLQIFVHNRGWFIFVYITNDKNFTFSNF